MGHDIVLNLENVRPKRKVRTHVFSAVTASASSGETHGQYCGWAVFLLFLKTNTLPKKASKLKIRGQSTGIHKFYFILWQISEVIASWKCINFQSLIAETWRHRGCRYPLEVSKLGCSLHLNFVQRAELKRFALYKCFMMMTHVQNQFFLFLFFFFSFSFSVPKLV